LSLIGNLNRRCRDLGRACAHRLGFEKPG